jgi:ankyrin repeat protein
VEVAEIVLWQGASVDGFIDGKSAFEVATMHGSEQMVQFLMNRNAGLGVGFAGGRTGFHWAALRGHFEIVKLLSTVYSVNDQDSQGLTPLHLATQCPNPDVVRFLLDKGARYDSPDLAEHWSPLH